MRPYYEDGTCTIYHGDARELLVSRGVDVLVCDAIVTDPPYGETSLEWDAWVSDWPALAALWTSAQQMWCFGSMRMFLEHAAEFDHWRFGQDIVWRKHNGSGFHADRFKRVHEHVAHWYRGAWSELYLTPPRVQRSGPNKSIRKRGDTPHTGEIGQGHYEDDGSRLQRSVIEVASCHGYAEHPTQKPTGIITPLLSYSVPPGGLVLDPFMGSGSTLRAAKDGGWRAIGIEAREDYCEIAAKRLAQEVLNFGGAA